MKVCDVMSSDVCLVSPDDRICDAAHLSFAKHGSLPGNGQSELYGGIPAWARRVLGEQQATNHTRQRAVRRAMVALALTPNP